MARRCRLPILALAILAALEGKAPAYDFEVRTRTLGQASELRSFRFFSADVLLPRRRFTQTLSLDMWNLGRRPVRRLYDPSPARGPRLSFSTYLRIDHDFGDYTGGELVLGGQVFDAIDQIAELEASSLRLDVLYAVFAAEGLAGGRVDVYAGRQIGLDSLDWFSMDGVTARARLPWHLAVVGFAGLRVRDSSFLGSYVHEPDGTSSAECEEYVEASRGWRPIDRERPGTSNPFRNDLDYCPQRQELMPTFGGAVETSGLGRLHARLGYRRSVSPSPGLIGSIHPGDLGFYPNELGQAPGWGVNEERLSASVRAPLVFARGKGQVIPYAAARYSLLHGLIDEAHAGVRARYGAHSVEPEVYYSFPTFDGDSIFNVFSSEPFIDARMTYDLAPTGSRWRAYLRGWLRSFFTEDQDRAMPDAAVEATALAAGVQGGVRTVRGRDQLARLDLFHEDGYGGRRSGGYGTVRWRVAPPLTLTTRLSIIDFREDLLAHLSGTTVGAQVGGTYVLHRGIALSVLVEENTNRIHRHQLSVFALLDMAFNPEL